MFSPLKKDTLASEAAEQIIQKIESGEFKTGDKLPSERDLALSLGVSRTTVREAIKSLSTIGYIETKHGGGNFISDLSLKNVINPLSRSLKTDKKLLLELIDVRKLLESETARLAAQNLDNIGKAGIDNAINEMALEIRKGELGLNGDRAFHLAVAKAAKNDALSIILEMCNDLLDSSREATLRVPGQGKKSLNDHMYIAEAIFARDSEEAEKRMMYHLSLAYKNIEKQNS
jgi:GntR family transcriptional repressor for pyruvate dehydrogenase complex